MAGLLPFDVLDGEVRVLPADVHVDHLQLSVGRQGRLLNGRSDDHGVVRRGRRTSRETGESSGDDVIG